MPEIRPPSRRVAVPLAALAVAAVGAAGWALVGPGRSSQADDAPARTVATSPATTAPTATSAPTAPVTPDPGAVPDPGAPSIAFFGDSLTAGVGAPPERGYAWQTAEALGWPIAVVDGVSGSGFLAPGGGLPMTERVATVVAAAPEVVVVAGGNNDAFRGYAPDEIEAAATEVLTELRAGLPDATVVALGPFTSLLTGGTPDATTAAVRAAAQAAGVEFIDATELVGAATTGPQGLRPYLSADGLHPNEAGYGVMATALAGRLPALVP